MQAIIGTILTLLAKVLVPFVSSYAGFKAGRNDKEVEHLKNENEALRKELSRINERPVTDNDIKRVLDNWKTNPAKDE